PAAKLTALLSPLRRPLLPTPFPYTTLFRSRDPHLGELGEPAQPLHGRHGLGHVDLEELGDVRGGEGARDHGLGRGLAHPPDRDADRKSTRLNSSHVKISYAVFCLNKKRRSW